MLSPLMSEVERPINLVECRNLHTPPPPALSTSKGFCPICTFSRAARFEDLSVHCFILSGALFHPVRDFSKDCTRNKRLEEVDSSTQVQCSSCVCRFGSIQTCWSVFAYFLCVGLPFLARMATVLAALAALPLTDDYTIVNAPATRISSST